MSTALSNLSIVDSQVESVDGGRSSEDSTSRPLQDTVVQVGLGHSLVYSTIRERRSGPPLKKHVMIPCAYIASRSRC